MKTKILLLTVAIGMTAVSCTNDYEFFDDGWESQSWEISLNQMVSQNVSLYSNSDLFLKDYQEININSLDSTSFINIEAKFPVLTGNHICLVPFAFIDFDTTMCHVKAFHIKNLIRYSMDHKSELTAVKLTWESQDGSFTSIALFDKKTGQLVYDNILYNTITSDNGQLNKFRKFKLTRSENSGGGPDLGIMGESDTFYGSDIISYGSGSIKIDWTCYGNWYVKCTYDYGMYMYRFDYTWVTSYIDWWWTSNNPYGQYNISTDARWVKDGIMPTSWKYKIKYYMWIGTKNNPRTIGLAYTEDQEISEYSFGYGRVKTYSQNPTRSSDYHYYHY